MFLPRLIIVLALGVLIGGCAGDEPNKVTREYAGFDQAERFAPVYHKTYVTIRPLEIWTYDDEGGKHAILAEMRAGDCYTDIPGENVPVGTHLFILDLLRIRTVWRADMLGEDRYPVAKVLDGKFAGWTVELSRDSAILIDPRVQYGVPPHLTWIPNSRNVTEVAGSKASTQP